MSEHRNIPNRIDKKTFGPYCWLRPEWPEQRLIRVLPDGGKGRTGRKERQTMRGRDDKAVMKAVFAGTHHNKATPPRPGSDDPRASQDRDPWFEPMVCARPGFQKSDACG